MRVSDRSTSDQATVVTPDIIAVAECLGVAEHLDPVIQRTIELFPGPVTLEVAEDPEFPGAKQIVVRVQAGGTVREILDREEHWHRQVLACSTPHVNVFQICIDAE